MLKKVLLFICFAPLLVFSQSVLPDRYFKGFLRSVKGGGFQYHSPQPDVTSSLLIRSIDSAQFIEWESEVIPEGIGSVVNLVWMFGIDANPDSHSFFLSVNGKRCITFSNPMVSENKPWQIRGEGGSTLLFRPTMLDKYNDPMGYAVLTLPVSMIRPGKPQVIRITGESKESRSWYMTFEAGVEENLTIRQVPALVRGVGSNSIPVLFQFVHPGEPVTGTIEIPGLPSVPVSLETGFTEVKILMPETTSSGEHQARITIAGKQPVTRTFSVSPIRHFTIYLVQHTHTDIGYTRPQTEILPDHLRYVDYALDFCDQTDSLPDDARFRWTCETSWAVREYLATRPAAQLERLKKRVKERRIELTGLFLNSSDLADESMIAATLEPVRSFRRQGFPVRSAMQSDINGVPWCLADYLPAAGIEYLNMAQNTHRADKPFDRPTTFWWESPSGNRLLVNRPEHYMWANSLGILSGTETFAKGLFGHLNDLVSKGYPFERYAIQFSGYLTDNSPPSTTACNVVDSWNSTYVWPKLRLATLSEFMDYVRDNHAGELQVIRGAWPDWWMDGFGSAAIQTAYARTAHADYIANNGLMAIADLMEIRAGRHIRDLAAQITDDIAFYDEHTFGAAESITDPLCENSVVQLGEKEAYVWSAVKKNRILREEVMGQIQQVLPKAAVPTITVFNTLNWMRSGNVLVYIDHQLLPKERNFNIIDLDGSTLPAQQVSTREEGSWWMIRTREILPMGFRTYRIMVEKSPVTMTPAIAFNGLLENDYYRIAIDRKTGRITGFFDKTWNRSLVDTSGNYSTGEFIYERLGKNRAQLEQHRLDEFTRNSWHDIRVSDVTQGAVWQSITLTGTMEGCADPTGIRCEIRLYNHDKKVEFCYSMKKLMQNDPEGVYVAFPFNLSNAAYHVEVAGGTMIPGKTQIEGSSTDWTGIQNFVALRSDSGQVVFSSPEIPLVQLGAINTGKFYRTPSPGSSANGKGYPESGSLFSWVLNNYWTTNFLAGQEGELKWTYQITSGNDATNTSATRFGMEHRIPMLARVFPASAKPDSLLVMKSFFSSFQNNLVLVSVRPASFHEGVVLQLRESAGLPDSIPVSDPILSSITLADATHAAFVSEVNALEEEVKFLWQRVPAHQNAVNSAWIRFRPNETKFILVGRKQ